MNKTTLIRKVYMDCPICDKLHEVEERKRISTTVIKDVEVAYEEHYYFCANADEEECEFELGSMVNANLMSARNAYRIKMGLLTSNEIVKIRDNYGLSQVDLARLLGWGEATISRYESKAIQDASYDMMLRLVKDDPLITLELLKKNRDKFDAARLIDIRNRIMNNLESRGKEFLTRQTFKGDYAQFDEPSDSNGQKTLDIDKLEVVVSYLAESMEHFYKVKLMKSLWYADALSYKRTGKSMTGLVYRHEAMGALPVGHYNLMNLERINVKEEFNGHYEYASLHVYPNKDIDYSILSECEKSILDEVINKFKTFKANDIVEYMHNEIAYKKTKSGDIIPFDLAREIYDFV